MATVGVELVIYGPREDEAFPRKGMQEADVRVVVPETGVVRRGVLCAVVVVVVTLVPGLGDLRSRFAHAQPVWIVIACAFELLSVFAYVPGFRSVFCRRMSLATSYKMSGGHAGARSAC